MTSYTRSRGIMRPLLALKIVAAAVTVIGLLFAFLERYFAPTVIVTENSPNYPDWLKWFGWILTALGALAYVTIDWRSRHDKH
jgi:uncharacterized protein involved in cysteine biosynthesis